MATKKVPVTGRRKLMFLYMEGQNIMTETTKVVKYFNIIILIGRVEVKMTKTAIQQF